MSQETFDDYVDGLVVRKLDKPKLLRQEASRYWGEIMAKQYHFKRGFLLINYCRILLPQNTFHRFILLDKFFSNKKKLSSLLIIYRF